MKSIKLQNKLSLSKETVSNLTNPEMNEVQGGEVLPTRYVSCISCPKTACLCPIRQTFYETCHLCD